MSFFKYADFLVDNVNHPIGTDFAPLNLPLPIGLSFYTFQTMSYAIDVYRGKVEAQKNPFTLALFVCLFPQLIAGPIVRYESIAKELEHRTVSFANFSDGAKLFTIGLGKKVLIANNIGLLWDGIGSGNLSELSVMAAWLGVIAFGFQIYFDFSGYSDMAIGLGKMFGFTFPKNFNYPFVSRSITEFWRRWHMTLGGWFRDYVYISLGGSRQGKFKLYRNLFIVWGLTGLWHGASWNFVAWGLYFGVIISIEKSGLLRMLEKLHPIFGHMYFNVLLAMSWPLFLFENLSEGIHYMKIMTGFSGNALIDNELLYLFSTNYITLLLAIVGSVPLLRFIRSKITGKLGTVVDTVIIPASCVFVLLLSTAYLANESYNPFLYFRF